MKNMWDVTVLVLAVWNAFVIPFDIAFTIDRNDTWVKLLDLGVDIVFLIDIILMFFTSYVNKFGKEIKNSW